MKPFFVAKKKLILTEKILLGVILGPKNTLSNSSPPNGKK
jgi:hypothetical protein